MSVCFVGVLRMLGFSHSAVGGIRGTLGLFELFSSSLSSKSLSSLLPLMLSPSPSSESVNSSYASEVSPFGVVTFVVCCSTSGRISGSASGVWVGSGCCLLTCGRGLPVLVLGRSLPIGMSCNLVGPRVGARSGIRVPWTSSVSLSRFV